jgi:hypothetical protein
MPGPRVVVRQEHFDTIGGAVACQIWEGNASPSPTFPDPRILKDLGTRQWISRFYGSYTARKKTGTPGCRRSMNKKSRSPRFQPSIAFCTMAASRWQTVPVSFSLVSSPGSGKAAFLVGDRHGKCCGSKSERRLCGGDGGGSPTEGFPTTTAYALGANRQVQSQVVHEF